MELFSDAISRNIMVCKARLEANVPGSFGSMMVGGQFDFGPQVKKLARFIVEGPRIQDMLMKTLCST